MKKFYRRLSILTLAAGMLVNSAMANAVSTNSNTKAEYEITGVKLEKSKNSLQLRLETNNKKLPSIVATNEDGAVLASLIDAELNLAGKKSFRQENPFPGITAIEVSSVVNSGINIVVRNEDGTIVEETVERKANELIVNLTPEKETKKAKGNDKSPNKKLSAQISNLKQILAQVPTTQVPPEVNPQPFAQTPNQDVLVPNPQIVIDGQPKTQEVPQYLPRAVAPPVGDMSVSNLNTTPDRIDLGTNAPIRRLVLRDAPVREVLGTLSRYAGLNLVFTGEGQGANVSTTISLDIENEPVEDVFNYVLMVSGMQASRKNNTIFVGTQLPPQARNLISRTIRLNQVKSDNAGAFLATQGAEVQKLFTPSELIRDPLTNKIIGEVLQPTTIVPIKVAQDPNSQSAYLLQGLAISTDDRLNTITLIGEPSKVQLATSLLVQLDARKRQVAINVKVIDINLLNTDRFNSSFSFGVNDSFFVQDGGSASARFGTTAPATNADLNSPTGRLGTSPIVPNALSEANSFYDFDDFVEAPGTGPGTVEIDEVNGTVRRIDARGDTLFFKRVAGISENPSDLGISEITQGTDNIIRITRDAAGNIVRTFTPGTEATATGSLPSFFQFPKKFLAQLEAQVTNGNAKILTDPTLVVQESQQATVKLTQEIVKSVETSIDGDSGARTVTPVIGEAGLTLTVDVERIDDNGFISLSVSPTVSSVGATQTFDSGDGAENLLSLLNKRELTSGSIRLRDGQTLILSGIIQDSERTAVSKVPFLGDLPLIGALFRSTNKTGERAEVVVLVTPQVMDDSPASEWGYDYKVGPDVQKLMQQQGVTVPGN
jgi:type IV pilus assembly protein PilQ